MRHNAGKRGRPTNPKIAALRKKLGGVSRATAYRHLAKTRAKAKANGLREPHQRYQPPHGYAQAKDTLIRQGHSFERARRDWGFEWGVFVDGAYLESGAAMQLVDMPPAERREYLAKERAVSKDLACAAVRSLMRDLRVTVADLRATAGHAAVYPAPPRETADV